MRFKKITQALKIEIHLLTKPIRRTAAAAILAATLLPAPGQETPRPEFPAGIRLAATARGEAAIAALGNRLPELAAHYGKTPEQLRALFRSDQSLQANTEGRLFYSCDLHDPAAAAEADVGIQSIGTTDPAPFPTEEAFLLHSRPGANRVIYLDFDGHVDTTAGYWKDGASAPPFDLDGDATTFNSTERTRIIGIWQRVAEDYAMFDIDVTTEDPGIPALSKSSSSDLTYGIRCVIGGSSGGAGDWYTSSAGGVAYVGTFDVASDVPCWVFPGNLGNSEKNIAEAASHEAGHTLGLNHDGTSTASYYSGQGNWAPIMGVGYYKEIVQWSKGEYTGANNLQDDLAVMLTQGAVYRPDDHGSTTATATVLTADTIPLLTDGVIEKRTDLDFFRITAAGGSLAITVKPAPRDSNLRIEVKLYDAAGTVLQTATSADTSAGTQLVTLTRSVAVGDYFFSVDGIGNGDPLATGYTDYASLGQYLVSITGVLPAGATWLPTAAGAYQWNTSANWSINPVPSAAGVTLRINNNIAGNQTINLTAAATVGTLFLGDSNGTHGFTVASTGGTLTFDNLSASAGLGKTSGTNDVISAPLSLTGVLVVNQSSSGTLSFSGAVSGAGSLTKEGAGTLVLTGAKTYSGTTSVDDGVLRLDTTDALPTSNLTLRGGGVLGLASGNFSRANGTGANQVQWTGDGGFAAFGANRTVTPGTMSWSSTTLNGNALILGHATADATLIWSSNLSFAGATRTIQVDDGSAAIDARISGVLSGGGTFNKSGNGLLELTNANTYTAITSVNDGLLLLSNAAALPTTNLIIGGGILGLGSADLTTRTIGTSTSQVRWTADGGFAAYGATRAVKFSDTPVNWTATNFIGNGRTLLLGHATANATLDWQQAISLIDGSRTVEVGDGSADIDAQMSGVISGGSAANSPFNKTGEGTLAFTAQNTYDGDTILSAGTLMIGNGGTSGGVSQNSLNILVETGATLAVNRSDTVTQGSNLLIAAISGEGGFSQVGTGTTTLNLVNTYNGDTTINAGTLEISGTGKLGNGSYAGDLAIGTGSTFKYSSSSAQTLSGAISGAGAIIKDTNTSTLTLGGANSAFSGPVAINAGTLSLAHVNALGSAGAITLAGGTTLVTALNGISTSAPITLGATNTTSTVSFGIPTSATATLNLNGLISGAGNLTFTTPNNNSGNFQQTILLGSANSYGGSTQITAGNQYNTLWVRAGVDNALPVTTVLTLNGGNGSGSGRTVAYDLAGHDQTLAGLSNVSGYTLRNQRIHNSTGTAATLTIHDNANRVFSGTINGTNLDLTKDGGGTFTLAGANTFTGATTVSAGTLAMGANNVLADTTAVAIGNATLNAATFTDTVGTLDVTSTAKINLGTAAALAFADSSAIDWTGGSLSITGTFVSGSSLRFGTTNGGLTSAQLSSISATGFTGFGLDANGYLTATVAAGYSAWQSANSTSQTIDLDHDGDGVSNGVEYFLKGATNSNGFTALPGVTNTAGTLSVSWTKDAGYTGTYGTNFVVESSSTLSGVWATESLGVNVTITGGEVKYTFPAGSLNFARLKVTGP